jgi:Protein of unknown function (DUF2842)
MALRIRKLIGTVMLLFFITFYALVVMVLTTAALPRTGKVAEFLLYMTAGLLWVPPAGLIVRWMLRPKN